MPPARTYVVGNFQLVLDGIETGLLKSVDGGTAVAEVISEAVGMSHFSKKHLGPISYSPIVLEFGLGMTNNLYEWINASWSGKAVVKDGAIVQTDQNLVAVSQREFGRALLTETTFPALDGGASKDSGYLALTLSPEYTRVTKASGKVTPPSKGGQKLWLPSNFRVSIDGLDCTRISRVDSFTVKQSVVTDDIGETRDHLREPSRLEFPNLKITFAEASAKSWLEWFDGFVIKGSNDDSREKNGSISLLAANLVDELLRIDLFNLGIFKIGHDRLEANSDRVATVSAHLYCERMEVRPGGAPKAITRVTRTAGRRSTSRRKRTRASR